METPRAESSIGKHLAIAFAVALVGYIAFWKFDQHLRGRKGPWQTEFGKTTNGEPMLSIRQPALGIADVEIVFKGTTATDVGEFRFDHPTKQPPVGKMIYADLTYLPGVVVLDLHGHEVQMIGRGLYLDKKEHRWQNGARHILEPLPPTNAPPQVVDSATVEK